MIEKRLDFMAMPIAITDSLEEAELLASSLVGSDSFDCDSDSDDEGMEKWGKA